jgi:hypothetical protein
MKINEIVQQTAQPATGAEPAQQPATGQPQTMAEPEPSAQEIKQVQDLLGTIDPVKEQPQAVVNKLTGWLQKYPLLDKITDLIPQTRVVKAIARAVDALEQGDPKAALNSIASVAGGGIAQAARAVNVGSALAQGNVTQAALAAGGNVATAAKGVQAAQNLAQGDAIGAVSQFSPGAARVATTAQNLAKGTTTVDGELDRVKKLAGVQQTEPAG